MVIRRLTHSRDAAPRCGDTARTEVTADGGHMSIQEAAHSRRLRLTRAGLAVTVVAGLLAVGTLPSQAAPPTAGSASIASTTPPAPPAPAATQNQKPAHSTVPPGHSHTEIEVKFREGSGLRLTGSTLAAVAPSRLPAGLAVRGPVANASDISKVRAILSAHGASMQRLMAPSAAAIDASAAKAA